MTEQIDKVFRVMFVCTGNICRSPMAEEILRIMFDNAGADNVLVGSSGVGAVVGHPASEYAQEAVKTCGGTLASHRGRQLTEEIIEEYDVILALSPGHYHAILRMAPKAEEKTYLLKAFPQHGDTGEGIFDPIGSSQSVYNEVYLEIYSELQRIFPELLKMLQEKREGSVSH